MYYIAQDLCLLFCYCFAWVLQVYLIINIIIAVILGVFICKSAYERQGSLPVLLGRNRASWNLSVLEEMIIIFKSIVLP